MYKMIISIYLMTFTYEFVINKQNPSNKVVSSMESCSGRHSW